MEIQHLLNIRQFPLKIQAPERREWTLSWRIVCRENREIILQAEIQQRGGLRGQGGNTVCHLHHRQGGSKFSILPLLYLDFQPGTVVRRLACLHLFHTACVDAWLTRNRSYLIIMPTLPILSLCYRCCPVCRLDIEQAAAMFK